MSSSDWLPLTLGLQTATASAAATWDGLSWRQILVWALWLLGGFFAVFPLIVAYMTLAERKVAARFQDRIGPNRVGPFGLIQPIADFLKLMTKEIITPRAADVFVHLLAPILMVLSANLVLVVVPFGFGRLATDPVTGATTDRLTGLLPMDLPAGLLYLIAVSSLSSMSVFLAGWASRNKFSLLGAMRGVAQLISYEVPQVMATIPVILWAGSLSLVSILDAQVSSGVWNLFIPSGFLAFVLLTIASIAEVNRAPFDLPEAESELIAGYHTEYSGMRFGLIFVAEYLSIFGICCLGTALFLGGGGLPFTSFPKNLLDNSTGSIILVNLISIAIFLIKVAAYVFLIFWVRATLPRIRVDQLMALAWKWMVPLSIINVLIAAAWYEMTIRPGGPGFTVAWLATAVMVVLAILIVTWIYRSSLASGSDQRRARITPAPPKPLTMAQSATVR